MWAPHKISSSLKCKEMRQNYDCAFIIPTYPHVLLVQLAK